MPRLKSVRGPKLTTDKVSIVHERGRRNRNKKLLVTIRLSPSVLRSPTKPTSNEVRDDVPLNQVDELPKEGIAATSEQISSASPDKVDQENTNNETRDDLDSELSSIDEELMEFLTQHSVLMSSGKPLVPENSITNESVPEQPPLSHVDVEKKEELPKPPKKEPKSEPSPTKSNDVFRPLPKNISPLIIGEVRSADADQDEDFEPIDRLIFSLNDPLGGGRINLPVKSAACIHFECFDFENFCLFNKITTSTREITKKNLIKSNRNKLQRSEASKVQAPPAIPAATNLQPATNQQSRSRSQANFQPQEPQQILQQMQFNPQLVQAPPPQPHSAPPNPFTFHQPTIDQFFSDVQNINFPNRQQIVPPNQRQPMQPNPNYQMPQQFNGQPNFPYQNMNQRGGNQSRSGRRRYSNNGQNGFPPMNMMPMQHPNFIPQQQQSQQQRQQQQQQQQQQRNQNPNTPGQPMYGYLDFPNIAPVNGNNIQYANYTNNGQPYLKIINNPKPEYSSRFITPQVNTPLYGCPICSAKFPLSSLTISDGFNFFVKAAPKDIDRVELLVDVEKYRLVDDSMTSLGMKKKEDDPEVIVLSSDEEDDEDESNTKVTKNETQPVLNSTIPVEKEVQKEDSATTDNSNGGNGSSWEDPFVIE